MKDGKLPKYGIGPLYALVCIISALLALIFSSKVFPGGRIESGRMLLVPAAVFLALFAAFIWIDAVFLTRVDDAIDEGRLCTEGVYSWVRNPIYSAIMFLSSAVVILTFNSCLYLLIPLYWLFMSILVKNTEEKWLKDKFGREYEEYMKRVPRCIPLPPAVKRR